MIKKFLSSLTYAVKGFVLGVKEERNMRIDLVCMLIVLRLSFFYNFDKTQWALVIMLIFLIPSLELINTSVERAVDRPDSEHYMQAGRAKDAAAGGVFFMAAGAVIIAFVLFWDLSVIKQIISYYFSHVLRIGAVILFAVISYVFIMIDSIKKKGN